MRVRRSSRIFGDLVQVGADDLEDLVRVGKQIFQFFDQLHDLFVFVFNFLALEGCQTAQLHIENGLSRISVRSKRSIKRVWRRPHREIREWF